MIYHIANRGGTSILISVRMISIIYLVLSFVFSVVADSSEQAPSMLAEETDEDLLFT